MNDQKNLAPTSREVRLDRGGFERHYKNPLTKTYQYEYALYRKISELFQSVRCKSMCIETLRLYFRELPDRPASQLEAENPEQLADRHRKKKEDFLEEIEKLIQRDVAGKVTFPMMQDCQAKVRVHVEKDNTHSFTFTDGDYGFNVRLDMPRKGHPRRIKVRDVSEIKPEHNEEHG